MGLFIDPNQLVPVTEGDNTIWILAKMSLDVDTAVTVEFRRINHGSPILLQKAQNLALLKHNIKKWEGPDFMNGNGKPMPCDAAHIGQLDPFAPLLTAVLLKIDELNSPPVAEVTPEEASADPNLEGDGT